jgi:NAD(P)H-dependent FMN reductase
MNGKKVAMSGAGGKMATAKCREKLTELLTFIKAEVMEQQTGIVLNLEAWTEGRMILSEEQKSALKDQVEAVMKAL